jgi:hypothetical protein
MRGSCPYLASVLQKGRKNANIHAGIWGMSVVLMPSSPPVIVPQFITVIAPVVSTASEPPALVP